MSPLLAFMIGATFGISVYLSAMLPFSIQPQLDRIEHAIQTPTAEAQR